MDSDDLFNPNPKSKRRRSSRPREWKVVAVRECPGPDHLHKVDTPQLAADYWRANIATAPQFNPDVECVAVLLLNTKLRVKGHHIVSIGSLNEAQAHPREVFRAAIVAAAYAMVVMHNHPSGEPEPSEADRRFTKRLSEAGELIMIHVQDHVILGHGRHFSFREAGYL